MKSVFCMAYFNLKIRVICGICEGLQSSVRTSFRKEKSVLSVKSVRDLNPL
jgi:hypothetical protein